jgi:hypothetical protein
MNIVAAVRLVGSPSSEPFSEAVLSTLIIITRAQLMSGRAAATLIECSKQLPTGKAPERIRRFLPK